MSICQRSSCPSGQCGDCGLEPTFEPSLAGFPFSCISLNRWCVQEENRTFSDPYLFNKDNRLSRKEVFQPHLPVRLPCYDLAPITSFALGRSLRSRTSGAPGFHGLTGGVYKARERIHRAMADARLLANPASWGRVADPSPNWGTLSRLDGRCRPPALCMPHCNTCVAPDVRAVLI